MGQKANYNEKTKITKQLKILDWNNKEKQQRIRRRVTMEEMQQSFILFFSKKVIVGDFQ